jgi:hypothetical protein
MSSTLLRDPSGATTRAPNGRRRSRARASRQAPFARTKCASTSAPGSSACARPNCRLDGIRALQTATSESVTRHFDIGTDGSFDLDVAVFKAAKTQS